MHFASLRFSALRRSRQAGSAGRKSAAHCADKKAAPVHAAAALRAPAQDADIQSLYILLLGRLPESAAIIEAQRGRTCRDLLRDMLDSGEFRERVVQPFLSNEVLPHRRCDPMDLEFSRDWLAESGLAALAAGADWLEAFAAFLLAEPVARLCAECLPGHAARLQQKASALAGPEAARARERSERVIATFASPVSAKEEDRYYFEAHRRRYVETLAAMFQHDITGECALEIGTTFMFCHFVEEYFGFKQCDVTAFYPSNPEKITFSMSSNFGETTRNFRAFNLNIQNKPYPIADEIYDYVMFFETLEHLPTDPMFAMQEINRILKHSGVVFITTPNITALDRVSEILHGRHPYFFHLFNGTADRHNLEYSPELLEGLVEAAGFEIIRLWTPQVWDEPDPETMNFLKRNSFPTGNRGDCLFCLARKIGPVRDRYPSLLYSDFLLSETGK